MDKNIPLMLDSSTFKQVPKLNSQLFKELVKYTRVGIYKLYISEVIEREFITWIQTEAQGAFDMVTKATKSLNKYYEEPNILGLSLGSNLTVFAAENQINGVLKKVVNNWEEFKNKTNATVLPIDESHGKLVMNAYFSGEKPFDKIKNRSDIPDAFIYYSLLELLKSHEKVIFVTSDKRLLKNIQNEKIICFENISDLFSDGPSKLDDRYFNSLEDDNKVFTLFTIYEEEIQKKVKREIELSDLIEEIEEGLIDLVIGEYRNVSTDAVDLKVNINDIKNITELSFIVPFSASISHSVSSNATKAELSLLNDQRLINIEKNVNDNGDFEIDEKHYTLVNGHFSIAFENSNPSTWKEKKTPDHFWSEPEISEISVSVEDIQANA